MLTNKQKTFYGVSSQIRGHFGERRRDSVKRIPALIDMCFWQIHQLQLFTCRFVARTRLPYSKNLSHTSILILEITRGNVHFFYNFTLSYFFNIRLRCHAFLIFHSNQKQALPVSCMRSFMRIWCKLKGSIVRAFVVPIRVSGRNRKNWYFLHVKKKKHSRPRPKKQ